MCHYSPYIGTQWYVDHGETEAQLGARAGVKKLEIAHSVASVEYSRPAPLSLFH